MTFSNTKRITAAFFCIIMFVTFTMGVYATAESIGLLGSTASNEAQGDTTDCTCGETAPENLANHADSCPRKQYIRTLFTGKTAAEIYSVWESYDEATRTDILNMMQAYVYTTYDALVKLIEDGKDIAAVIDEEFATLSEEYDSVTEDSCTQFYSEMMTTYSKAFNCDKTIVTGKQMNKIDRQFSELQNSLYEDFGFTDVQPLSETDDGQFSTMGDTGEIYTYKNVKKGEDGVSDYLLSLESYITGETIDYVQPLDLILVLDQSASMYAPMGLEKGLDNKTLYTGSTPNLTRYAMDIGQSGLVTGAKDLKASFNSTETDMAGLTFKKKLAQLGYLVAQSRSGGSAYCTEGHSKHTEKCKTHDWFIVQYVENDSEGKPWHFHRVRLTACPSTDSFHNRTYINNEVKYADSEIGDSHFYYYLSQTGALYDSITSFAASMKNSGADHRLAVTGFSSGNSSLDGDNPSDPFGSGIYIDGKLIPYNSYRGYKNWFNDPVRLYNESTVTDEQYASALMSIQNNYEGVFASLNAVKTDYYQTYQNIGLDMALGIIKNATKVDTDLSENVREKVVVLFTDGEPSGPKQADVVAKAAEVKATGAKIYTVCTSTLSEAERSFLTYSSSDYPNATATIGDDSTIKSGSAIAKPQYSKTAKNAASLVNEFLSIINNVVADLGGANVQLTKKTILQDTISGDFTLPKPLTDKLKAGASVDDIINKYIKVYTSPYNGKTFGEKVAFNDATVLIEKDSAGRYNVVKVTNFNYTDNYVTQQGRGENNDFYGNKLIVEIAIDTSETNFGGNKLATNVENDSGIYYENVKFNGFKTPYVDVPTSVTVTKYVVGKNADVNMPFDFSTSATVMTNYQYSNADGNYLQMNCSDTSESYQLSNSRSRAFTNVKVGSVLTIRENPNEDYNARIKIYDKNDRLLTNAETLQADGSYKITVVPGMKIVYTNAVTNAGLTITKDYGSISDSKVKDQSTIFRVTDSTGKTIEVIIVGRDSITINNLPVGEYTVTEIQEWSWRYDLKNVKTVVSDNSQKVTDGIKFVLTEEGEQVVFTNSREEEKWLSGDCYCENIWPSKKDEEEDKQ